MRKIIIGSTALRHHYPEFPREPKDLDYVVEDQKQFGKTKGVEYLENPVLIKYESSDYISPDILLTLKMSHMFWDINWNKHLFDIQFLLNKGHKYDLKLLEEFIGYWNTVHKNVRRSDLSLDKEQFFTNAVNQDTFEHDYLHTLLNPVPMYTRLLKEGCEVELDEKKWDSLSFEEKCEVVREESYVMAWERYKATDYRIAFKKQLKDNIIKHFPKFIALFAIGNYPKLERPEYNYINFINNKLKENGHQENQFSTKEFEQSELHI